MLSSNVVKSTGWFALLFSSCARAIIIIPEYFGTNVGLNNEKMILRRAALVSDVISGSLCCPPMIHGKSLQLSNLETLPVSKIYDNVVLQCGPCPRDWTNCKPFACLHQRRPSASYASLISSDSEEAFLTRIWHLFNYSSADECFVLKHCLRPFGPASKGYEMKLWQQRIQKPRQTMLLADMVVRHLFGEKAYISLHLRLEELHCSSQFKPGAGTDRICFRSGKGPSSTEETFYASVSDIVSLLERIKLHSLVDTNLVFFATDAYARGRADVADRLRVLATQRNFIVKMISDARVLNQTNQSSFFLSELEQEVHARGRVLIGHSTSSWDWESFYTSAAKTRRNFDLLFDLEYNKPSKGIYPTHGDGIYLIDRLLQDGLLLNTDLLEKFASSRGAGCEWVEQASRTNTINLDAFCALWPFTQDPCSKNLSALTAGRQKLQLLKIHQPRRQSGILWPFCQKRLPSSAVHRVWTCNAGAQQLNVHVSLNTLLNQVASTTLVRNVILYGDSLVGQYADLIACAIAGHGHFESIEFAMPGSVPFAVRRMTLGNLSIFHLTPLLREKSSGMWNDVVAARLKIMTERLQLIPHETTVCINIGLHYLVQDEVSKRYDSDMRMLIRDIDQFAPRLFVWVHTTAVHPQTMTASVDEKTVAKFSKVSLDKVRALNSKAAAAVHKSTTPHTIVDAFAPTNTLPDGLYPGDIRHYRSEVIETITKLIFIAVIVPP